MLCLLRRSSAVVLAVLFVGAIAAPSATRGGRSSVGEVTAQAPSPQDPAFFEERIRPIFVTYCEDCHTDDESGGLRVDSLAALLRGGTSGPAIVPGKPDESLLVKVIRRIPGYPKMPRVGPKLSDENIAAFEAWIQAGATWPGSESEPAAPVASHEKRITPEQRAYWAFQPIERPEVPAVANSGWPRSDIDRFVLARLEAEGLSPVAEADKLTLIRRATLDLTGLPPTPEEIDAFLADESPDACRQVDRPAARLAAVRRDAGAGTGSTSRATARTTIAASIRWAAATTRIPTRTCTATG